LSERPDGFLFVRFFLSLGGKLLSGKENGYSVKLTNPCNILVSNGKLQDAGKADFFTAMMENNEKRARVFRYYFK